MRLELQFLLESGRIRLRHGGVSDLVTRGPWLLDDPPATAWFEAALDLSWTRDPFDRLLVAHAHLRGWRLATGDTALLERLPSASASKSDCGRRRLNQPGSPARLTQPTVGD